MNALNILHLEDNPLDAELVLANLEAGGMEVVITRVETGAEFGDSLDRERYDLVLADYSLPMFDGLTALRQVKARGLDLPFILLSGAMGEEVAIESLKSGATDYVLKHRLERLVPSVLRALRETQERAQRKEAEEALRRRQEQIEDLNKRLQRAMAESHHRIKNNLQVLSALLDMQIMNSTGTVPVAELERLNNHIHTLAVLHDLLTAESKTGVERTESISIKAVLERMVPMLATASGGRDILVDADDVSLTLKLANPFVLLVNELVSNAIKHGAGTIQITLHPDTAYEEVTADVSETERPSRLRLVVCDDGPGFPPDFDPKQAANTGLELIESLVNWDLHGQVEFENRCPPDDRGARVIVTFPNSPAT